MRKTAKLSFGVRLSLLQAALIIMVMGIFTVAISAYISKNLEKKVEQDLVQQVALLENSISSYHAALADSSNKLMYVFRTYFPGNFVLNNSKTIDIAGRSTPILTNGATTLNLNSGVVDRFSGVTGAVGTVFARSGDDFVRIATSLKKADGGRAVGTSLDRSNPAYRKLVKGEGYAGKAILFGKDYVTSYQPIKDDHGAVIGALFVGLDFSEGLAGLKNKIRNIKIGKTGYFYALDAQDGKDQGKLQIHPLKEGVNIIDSKDSDGREFIKEMMQKKEGIIRYPWLNKEAGEKQPRVKLAAYRHLAEWNWLVVGGSYLDELNSEARLLRNAMIGATILVVLILVLAFMYITRIWLSKPLKEALDMTELLAAGDFRDVAGIEADRSKSADEIEQISQGIKRMAWSLRTLLEKINNSSHEVSSAAAQVSSIAERIATGSEQVASQADTVATAGEEMAATSGDIAQNCQMAAEGAQHASRAAVNGAEVVEKTVAVMGQIAEKVQESAKTVESLGARSDQIGAIIGTIEDIADQTNLLALNAAIEAARAGEQGRGFAVVADEVRALAERTTGATREIGEMIKAIQQETKGAVIAMGQGVMQVEHGSVEASKSGRALSEILEQINSVVMQVNQIATASEEQTATTSEISSNMMQITEVVRQTSEGAHESADAAVRLNSNAEELKRLVLQFKL